MTTKKIDEIGQRVCAKGQGTDALAHYHGTVSRLTATMIIVTDDRYQREHRFSREWRTSIPRSDWGGLRIALACQKK
jgi:hypothetical protein